MKTLFAILFCFLSFNFCVKVNAQKLDTLRIVSYTQLLDSASLPDTLLQNFHNQIPYIANNYFATLGAIVLPQRNLFFSAKNNFGFRLMNNVYSNFEFTNEDVKYYHAITPLTDMGFGVGSKKESYFSFFHTQNLGKRLNFCSALKTARSEAFYKNQNPSYINFLGQVQYATKNRKYLALGSVIFNRINHKENGGIDTNDLYDVYGNRQLPEIVNTTFATASFKKNSNIISLRQTYSPQPIKDSSALAFEVDKLGTTHFYHQFNYNENWMRYYDTLNTSFTLKPNSHDTAGIKQYLYHHQIENSIGYQRQANANSTNSLSYNFYAKHSYNYISQPLQRFYFSNVWVFADMSIKVFKDYFLNANYTQALAGYNLGDFNLETTLSATKNMFGTPVSLGIKASSLLSEPTFIQSNFNNYNFIWKNNFKKVGITSLAIFAKSKKSIVELTYFNIANWVYFNNDVKPTQQNINVGLIQFHGQHTFKFRHLHLATDVLIQKNVAINDVLQLPQFLITEQLFFEGYLFKKSLLSQAGVQFNYCNSYFGNAYMPLLNQLYNQNKILVGGYPQLDVFFNFKIRTVRIFVKASNLNYGFFPQTIYYQTPLNPMFNRLIRIGVIWRFLD